MIRYDCIECGTEVHDKAPWAHRREPKLCCLCLRHPGWMTDPVLVDLMLPRCSPCTGGGLDSPPRNVKPVKPPKGVW